MYKPIKYIPQVSQKHQMPIRRAIQWSWMAFAQKFVPAAICLWSLIMVSGVVLGCFYGKII